MQIHQGARRLERPVRWAETRTESMLGLVHGRGCDFSAKIGGTRDGRVKATFQVLYLTAWSPHESQQQPARRGSGTVSLADALKEPDES